MVKVNINIDKNSKYYNLIVAILFGVLASCFGHVYFEIVGYKYAYTDLREIPIIIGLFYLRNPLYILLIVALGSYRFFNDYPYWATVILHIPAAYFTFYLYHLKIKKISNVWINGSFSLLLILVYYYVIVLPSFVITYEIFGLNVNRDLIENYINLVISSRYEIVTTSLVTSLYAIQLYYSYHLKTINNELEVIIENRTSEIAQVNEQLVSLNTNLEQIVEQRTKRINEQLEIFQKYAHLNSHDLRAPLARVMGLVLLLQNEQEADAKKDILDKLLVASKELDAIVHEMNRLLNIDDL